MALFISGCGSTSNNAGINDQTGHVALLITDAPIQTFSKIFVTVEEDKVIAENENSLILFQGSRRLDLLAMKEVEDLFYDSRKCPQRKL